MLNTVDEEQCCINPAIIENTKRGEDNCRRVVSLRRSRDWIRPLAAFRLRRVRLGCV